MILISHRKPELSGRLSASYDELIFHVLRPLIKTDELIFHVLRPLIKTDSISVLDRADPIFSF